jgi:hypothetical protein
MASLFPEVQHLKQYDKQSLLILQKDIVFLFPFKKTQRSHQRVPHGSHIIAPAAQVHLLHLSDFLSYHISSPRQRKKRCSVTTYLNIPVHDDTSLKNIRNSLASYANQGLRNVTSDAVHLHAVSREEDISHRLDTRLNWPELVPPALKDAMKKLPDAISLILRNASVDDIIGLSNFKRLALAGCLNPGLSLMILMGNSGIDRIIVTGSFLTVDEATSSSTWNVTATPCLAVDTDDADSATSVFLYLGMVQSVTKFSHLSIKCPNDLLMDAPLTTLLTKRVHRLELDTLGE